MKNVDPPELIFGLVGYLGADTTQAAELLRGALQRVGYASKQYRLSHLMRELKGVPFCQLKDEEKDKMIHAHMNAGNEMRRMLGNSAVALLGVSAIREQRKSQTGDYSTSLPRFAHILNSLKRKEEVETLRRIYGPALIVLSIVTPRSKRLKDLTQTIASSYHQNQSQAATAKAEELLLRDEREALDDCGQRVEDTFPIADVFIDGADRRAMENSIWRMVQLVFGNLFITPSPDEQGMYLARAASFRSASLARQVGAAICRPDGSVVSIGTNEVSKPLGGQYWPDDESDHRDFALGYDSSDKMRENLLGEILEKLKQAGWLDENRTRQSTNELVREALRGQAAFMKGAQFNSTIDFVRAVHAEMAAISDAARHGTSTVGCTLYTTTFPCHDCAKHIVVVGISKVVYLEAYRKSHVKDLHENSIGIDETGGTKVPFVPFIGVAPRRFSGLFGLNSRRRKKDDGSVIQWREQGAVPSLPEYMSDTLMTLTSEFREMQAFLSRAEDNGMIEKADHNGI